MFFILCNVNGGGLHVFRSPSIDGPWEHNLLPNRHDMSVLFDDDLDKVFIISGGGSPYPIEELSADLRSFDTNAPVHHLTGQMGEGHHLYKIKGKYVDLSAIPGGTVDQMVAVADSIDGPWKTTHMVEGESLGVTVATPLRAQTNDRGLTLHQGGMCDTPSGEWWCTIMSDHGSAGRMVSLVPITWDDGFPLIGLPGNLRKAPNTWLKPDTGFTQQPMPTYVPDDNFNDGKMNPHWQWNHVPDDARWSQTEKPGVLRLHSLSASDFFHARNSLCQRPPGPESIMSVELDTTGLLSGDAAGLALLSAPYAWIGVVKNAEGTTLQMVQGTAGRRGRPEGAVAPVSQMQVSGATNPPSHLWLRVHCNFDNDQAIFSWSADGREFTPLGKPFIMTFQLTTFQGVRPALFNFNTSGQPGGYADFDNYTVEEPRARGIEREIPMGKRVTFTSGADGSLLAADAQSNLLVNLPAAVSVPAKDVQFKVVDLGKGRVALQTGSGLFVSVAEDGVTLKGLTGRAPGDAESFLWINLMRGDTAFMSLVSHRYLATKPNETGPVTATAAGPSPARKNGVCFKWKTVD
jgi:beta-xylosidase